MIRTLKRQGQVTLSKIHPFWQHSLQNLRRTEDRCFLLSGVVVSGPGALDLFFNLVFNLGWT